MKKLLLIMSLALMLGAGLASAHEHNFTEAKQLIDSNTPCSQLTNEQLELIGDYYMEQMHPGEQHELMDNMMGGEGSEYLKQVHINMAKRLYCKENVYVGYGMMNSGMMPMMFGGGNMPFGYGMMNGGETGMMGTFGTGLYGALYFLLVLGLVILVYLWIWKLWKELNRKK